MDLLPSPFGIETDDTSIFLIEIRSMDIGIGSSSIPYFLFNDSGYVRGKCGGGSDE